MNLRKRWRTFFGVFVLSILCFTSCDNFLQGTDVKEEITKSIEYNNAPSYAINVEALAGTGTIKTPATGEVTKKVTDTFTIRFEPAENHKFIKWEAVVKGMSTGEKAADYITFEDSESLETKVTFKKASSKTIVLRPVCPEYISVKEFNLSAADKAYPKDSTVILTFNKPIAEDCINKISLLIPGLEEGDDYRSYFKEPQLKNDNQVIFYADWNKETGPNYIPVAANGNKLITVTIPKDKIYYVCNDYLEPVKLPLNKDLTYTYSISSETSKQVNLKFLVAEGTNGTLRINDELPSSVSDKQSIGKTLNLRYKPSDGYYFDKWAVTRKYKNVLGEDTIDTVYIDKNKNYAEALAAMHLSVLFLENEDAVGYDSLSNVAQAVITVDNYIDGDITISPLNKPRVNVTFAVDDEANGNLKIGEKNLYTQDMQYSIKTSIQFKYKPADGFIFSHWQIKAGNDEVLVNSLEENVLNALKSKFYFDFSCPDESDLTQAVIYIDDYKEGTITVKPINKPRVSFLFTQAEDNYGSLKVNGVISDDIVRQYSVGKTVNLTFKVSEGYKYRGWTVSKLVSSEGGTNQYEQLSFADMSQYLTLTYEDETLIRGYNEDNRTATAYLNILDNYTGTLVIAPEITQIPIVNVKLEVEKGTGTTSPSTGVYSIREGNSTAIDFAPSGDFEFVRWEFFDLNGNKYDPANIEDKDRESKIINTTIREPKTRNTTFTIDEVGVLADNSTIVLRPVVAVRPKSISKTPTFDEKGSRRDTTIQIMFDRDMSPNSIYYDKQELKAFLADKDSFETLLGKDKAYTKTDLVALEKLFIKETSVEGLTPAEKASLDSLLVNFYGYTTESDIFFKNISIINNYDGTSLLSHFDAPRFENARTLSIPVDNTIDSVTQERTNLLPSYTQALVTISKDLFYEEDGTKISMNDSEKWVYQVSEDIDDDDPVPVTASNAFKVLQKAATGTSSEVALSQTAPTDSNLGSISNLGSLKFLENNKLYLDFAVTDQDGGLSSVFKLLYTKIYDKDYKSITKPQTQDIGLTYTGLITQRGVYKGPVDLSELDDGTYKLQFEFVDRGGNSVIYPDDPYYFSIDKVKPAIDAPTIVDDLTTEGQVNFAWTKNNTNIPDLRQTIIAYKKSGSTDDYTPVPVDKAEKSKSLNLNCGTPYDIKVSFVDYNNNITEYESNFITRPAKPANVVIDALNNETATPRAYGDTNALVIVTRNPVGNLSRVQIIKTVEGVSTTEEKFIDLAQEDQTEFEQEFTSLDNAKTYKFEVRTYDEASGKYSLPYKVSGEFPSFATLPTAPTSLSTSFNSFTDYGKLSYTTPSSAFSGLKVIYSTSSDFSNPVILSPTNSSSSSYGISTNVSNYRISSLTAGTYYYIKVRSWYNNENNYVDSTRISTYTRPNKVTSFAVKSGSITTNNTTLEWTKPAGRVTGYRLYYKKSSVTTYPSTYTAINNGDTLSYTFTDLDSGTKYDYKIQAISYNISEDIFCAGNETYPAPVTNLSAVKQTGSNEKIDLSWTAPAGLHSKLSLYKTTSENSWTGTPIDVTGKTAYTDTVSAGTTYYYKVVSESSTGLKTETSVINISTYINPVTNLSATVNSDTMITLNWTNPSGGYDGLRIQKAVSGGSYELYTTITNKSTTSCSLSLTPNTYYYFRVVAFKEIEGVERTATATPSSGYRTKASLITGLKATVNSTSQITLNWSNPSSTSYWSNTYIYDNGSQIASWSSANTPTSYVVTGLEGGSSHTYSVRTTNSAGTTNTGYSTVTAITTVAPVTNLSWNSSTIDTTSAKISWTNPSGTYTGVKVYYKKSGDNWPSTAAHTYTDKSTTSCTLTGLSSGTTYNFKVVAYTSAATSPESTCTGYTKSAAVGTFALSSRDTTSLKFSWTVPNSNNYTGLTLYYKKSSNSSYTSVPLSKGTTSYTITGLTAGTTYHAFVRTYYYSTSYCSDSSVLLRATTPAQVTGLTIKASGGSTVLNWNAASGNRSNYRIYYKPHSSSSYTYIEVASSATSYTFANSNSYLTAGATYDFYIAGAVYDNAYQVSTAYSTVTFAPPPPGITNLSIYQDSGLGVLVLQYYCPTSSYVDGIDLFIGDTYYCMPSYSSGSWQTFRFDIKDKRLGKSQSYSRTTSYTIRLATYHGNNSSSGDTASWAQNYTGETYGPSQTVSTGTSKNMIINGTSYSYSRMMNVITSRTYVDNTNNTYSSHYDGAFPKKRYVYLSPYSMGAYEVTQQLFNAVMGQNPSTDVSDYKPVNNVCWYDAIAFCNKLSVLHGLKPYYVVGNYTDSDWASMTWTKVPGSDNSTWNQAAYDQTANGYRLPTECQHEFAGRGGDTGYYQWGYSYPGSNTLDDVAWISRNSGGYLHGVGNKPANWLGLYDMSGNIKEWLTDWNNDPGTGTYYDPYCTYNTSATSGSSSTPSTLKKKESKVLLKGGYYGSNDNAWNDSNADKWGASQHDYSTGFRICSPLTY